MFVISFALLLMQSTPSAAVPPVTSAAPAPSAPDRPARPARDRAAEERAVAATDQLAGSRLASALTTMSDRGNLIARWQLAVLHDTGERGVLRNRARALSLARSAAAEGEPLAYVSLGVLYATADPPDYAASMRSYRAGARLGQAHGLYGVGVLYERGQGVEQDRPTALGWFIAAAVLGDDQAQGAVQRLMTAASDDDRRSAVVKANVILTDHGYTGPPVTFGTR
jgi:TPR repeat protein